MDFKPMPRKVMVGSEENRKNKGEAASNNPFHAIGNPLIRDEKTRFLVVEIFYKLFCRSFSFRRLFKGEFLVVH